MENNKMKREMRQTNIEGKSDWKRDKKVESKSDWKRDKKAESKSDWKRNKKTEVKSDWKRDKKAEGKPDWKRDKKSDNKLINQENAGKISVKKAAAENKDKAVKAEKRPVIQGQFCPVEKRCGGCQYLHLKYEEQLKIKQKKIEELMKPYCKVYPITGMSDPFHYRNKVHAVFAHKRDGSIISGTYEEGTHNVVPVKSCLLENQKADEIIGTIRELLKSFKIKTYNEDTGYGLFRHALIRVGHQTGEIMVVLVLGSPILPSKNNFVKALRKAHPEITTVVLNVNDKKTSMVLGEKESVLYGKGYIEDILCGCRFRISAKSFYQINSVQTEALYGKAMELAQLTGSERVIDAYCGIGTIGMVAAKQAGEVIGVELNPDAVRDAVRNAKTNNMSNIRFYQNDAGQFMVGMAEEDEKADVVFMDPPRSGSDEAFLSSVVKLSPKRIVYISCGPDTQARDLEYLTKHGYKAEGIWPFDLFPFTSHVETVCLLLRK